MKIIKLFTPLFATISVVAATTSIASCNSYLGNVITTELKTDTDDNFTFESSLLQLKKDTLYTVTTNLSKVKKIQETPLIVLFFDTTDKKMVPTFKRVAVNNQSFNEMDPEKFEEGGWGYDYPYFGVYAKDGIPFKLTGEVQISFVLNKDIGAIRFAILNDS